MKINHFSIGTSLARSGKTLRTKAASHADSKGIPRTANELNEVTGPINENGCDVNVINKQIPVRAGTGSLIFKSALWQTLALVGFVALLTDALPRNVGIGLLVTGTLVELVLLYMKRRRAGASS